MKNKQKTRDKHATFQQTKASPVSGSPGTRGSDEFCETTGIPVSSMSHGARPHSLPTPYEKARPFSARRKESERRAHTACHAQLMYGPESGRAIQSFSRTRHEKSCVIRVRASQEAPLAHLECAISLTLMLASVQWLRQRLPCPSVHQ